MKRKIIFLALFLLLIPGIIFLTRYWINNPCLNILVENHCLLKTAEPILLLTFDDGPHPENTVAILDLLKKQEIFAIFFVNGNKIERHAELAKLIVESGHLIANHSYAHDELIFKSYKEIEKDLLKTDSLILESGESELNYFRAPYGKSFVNLPRVLKNQNKQMMSWSIAPTAQFDQDFNPQKVRDQILSQLEPGAIILLHDGSDNASPDDFSRLLEDLISEAKEKGFNFIKSRASFETILKNS